METNEHTEIRRRISNLHTQSYNDLIKVALRLTKSQPDAEELVSQLYEYLLNKSTPKLYWGESFNILYCNKFIYSKFINRVKRTKVHKSLDNVNIIDEEYDMEFDQKLEEAHNEVMKELKRLERTKMWAPSKIFELYMMSEKTLDEVANDIGISKSTTFLSVKKIRTHLQNTINNPFGKA
jgi:RNA polymerase sigma factor (sigma-70 family)